MKIVFASVCFLFFVQLVYPFVTVLLGQLIGKQKQNEQNEGQLQNFDFACIITAYRNVGIAQPLVESLLKQSYPKLTVYLVADECEEFDFEIQDTRFLPFRPPEPLRLKAKSILHALEHFKNPHDYVVIFDADNLAHPEFLQEINRFANLGFPCIQGQRTAKNLDSQYAALDSMGEHYKNYIERETPFRLGGSAVISGSGMATETQLYRAYLHSPDIEQGKHLGKKMLQEDKILQNFLLRQGHRIAYARQAIVFDEKVSSASAVETQRSRWLFSYFQNLPNAIGILARGLRNFSFNQVYFGFVTLVLPMFIQWGIAICLAIVAFFIAPVWAFLLLFAIAIFALNLFWVLKLDAAPPAVWRSVWQAPKFVFRQFLALLKMRDPHKQFKHTEHEKIVRVEELLRPEKKTEGPA